MADYYTEAVVSDDGSLIIKHIPNLSGHKVEVIIKDKAPRTLSKERYTLLGSVQKYENPFDGVAVNDWNVMQ